MKWFKHLVESGDDPFIGSAIILFGSDGYYVFFRTLEIMSREFDIQNPGRNTFLWQFLREKYRVSGQKLTKILSFFDQNGRIFSRTFYNDKVRMIELYCPKLEQLCDEYAQKKLAKCRDIVGKKSGTRQQTTDNRLQTSVVTGGEEPRILNMGGAYMGEIIKKCQTIHDLQSGERGDKKINVEAWVNQAVKKGGHPKAIDYALDHLAGRWKSVLDPWPYVESIFQMQNGNFWEREHVQESKDFQIVWESVDDKIKGLIDKINIGGGIE